MPNLVIAGFGGFLVLLVAADVFQTVLWSGRGGGPLTTTVTAVGRWVSTGLRTHPSARSAVGPAAIVAVVLVWTSGLLVGFTLATQIDADGLRSTTTGAPASWSERAYTLGYTIFTLGNGDFGPSSDVMRALLVVANASGMLLVTLAVTYLIPIVSASVASRAFAEGILCLGDRASDIVVGAWDGERVQLDDPIRSAQAALSTLAHQHLAYPVLLLFDSPDESASAPLAVERLDEVLDLLDAIDPTAAPPSPGRRQLRASIERYRRTFGRDRPRADAAHHADPRPLEAAGIPLSRRR